MKQSQRIPGPPLHYIDATALRKQGYENAHRHDVDGDGNRGIAIRLATREDALRLQVRAKPSSLK